MFKYVSARSYERQNEYGRQTPWQTAKQEYVARNHTFFRVPDNQHFGNRDYLLKTNR